MPRPGKYIEYDFPLHEVNRLAVKEANAKKPIYTMHKWWARRLSCVFRTILLASMIDWEDWDRLEPWKRDEDGDFVDADGNKITDESQYHRRVRDPEMFRESLGKMVAKTPGAKKKTVEIWPRSAWERLYYRWDDEANAVIEKAFKGKTILDPFMGGGTTVVEALRLGANVVGVDLNPVAWFIVKKETDGCDLELLERAFKAVEAKVADRIKHYYKTTCPCCGERADVMYNFWVKLAPCMEQTCGAEVPLYNSFVLAKKKGGGKGAGVPANKAGQTAMPLAAGPEKGIQFVVCESCGEVYGSKEELTGGNLRESTCPCCGHTFDPSVGYAKSGRYTCHVCGRQGEILTAAQRNIPPGADRNYPLPYRLFAVELYCPYCEYKGYKKAGDEDQALFEEAKAEFEATKDTLGFPIQEIQYGEAGRYPASSGTALRGHAFRYWHELFNERQLLCLCWLRDAILGLEPADVGLTSPPDPLSTRGEGEARPSRPKLRREGTPTEGMLWEALRDRRLGGLKFRRQHPLGRYIADFYCAEARLVLELDGAVHEDKRQADYDQMRDAELAGRGLHVLRLRNEDVEKNLPAVLARIRAAVADRPAVGGDAPHPPTPSPLSGEGEPRASGAGVRSDDLWNVKEYLLLAWSDALDLYNTFARYEPQALKIGRMFQLHGIVPRVTYTENHLWGVAFGRGSFSSQWAQVLEALRWRAEPSDNLVGSDGEQTRQRVPDGFADGRERSHVAACSSEDLGAVSPPTCSLVATDPPYYGNVMYAELSDFFYVWLHTALEDRYPAEFAPPHAPKEEEVVENEHWGGGSSALMKSAEFFTTGLTRVFTEAQRYLALEGLMVFTFHHQENEAWGSVLRTVLDAGMYITAIYPVHAEMQSSLHIRDKANIAYDAVIVCRKQTAEPERIDWIDLSDRIYLKAQQLVRELEYRGQPERGDLPLPLPPEDIYVIVIGKCLEEYSRHYYNGRSYVTKGGEAVSIDEALNGNEDRGIRGIGAIVDELVEEAEGRMWPGGLDPVSRFYVINFLGQSEVPYDRLHRRLQHNSQIELGDLERQHLIEVKRGKVKVIPEPDREEYLNGRMADTDAASLVSSDDTPLTYIDRLHMLYNLDQQSVLGGGLIGEWQDDATFVDLAVRVATYLDPSHKSQPVYQRIAEALRARESGRLF